MESITPKFKIGDHVSDYSCPFYGRRTGVITEIAGVYHFRGKDDPLYRYTDDLTGETGSALERNLKKCRSAVDRKSIGLTD